MRTNASKTALRNMFLAAVLSSLCCALAVPSHAQTPTQPPKPKPATVATPPAGETGFATPKAAADALIQAADQFDQAALREILGPAGEELVSSKDPVADKNHAAAFAVRAKEKNSVAVDPKNPNRATISIGAEDWPLPIPIVRIGTKWYFDTKAGAHEVVARRIGENELDAITVCRGYVDAQIEYALETHDDAGPKQYAQKIISTPGKHDGLAWKNDDGTWGGPVGEAVAKAIEQGYSGKVEPYHGYYFKILKGQGPAAPLGQLDYVIQGAMIGGFALIAAPAEYGVTGIQTFIVSYNGIVYQKDLGPDTLKIAKDMERYNPDKTWKRTDDEW
ncbi:MAG TPA: DUF2950 domain-containing protein [Candidatus Acidoferrales bacterium]|nr:DUF2950 domain-containing protein [Candidatus Acidoferrales bacterium]